ncbi:MAG: tRNA pseudouridine(38-40) synthase TruA [Schaedlerella sp.]|nr:tRNA pseudouridine(38-40) synthase TruA [Schaedlerella sp.]
MRTYKLTISYDGSRYLGWQKQPDIDLTIQGTLERAVSKLAGHSVEVFGSGRTDGGVHAKGQTASIVLPQKVNEKEFLTALNQELPKDIRVLDMEFMKVRFHARYSAKSKCYEYTIDTREKADVFMRKYTFHYPETLDLEKMKKAADLLIGYHDFAGYTDRPDEKSSKRWIYSIKIEKDVDKIRIAYCGSGFMYHMVRILTGTLLDVGCGRRSVESVLRPIESGVRADAGFLAPASGLCLKEVYY